MISIAGNFHKADLHSSVLDGANAVQCHFAHSFCQEVSFKGANLTGASFHKANLENADFEGADLTGARLSDAWLHGANFKGAIVKDAIFADAHITPDQREILIAGGAKEIS